MSFRQKPMQSFSGVSWTIHGNVQSQYAPLSLTDTCCSRQIYGANSLLTPRITTYVRVYMFLEFSREGFIALVSFLKKSNNGKLRPACSFCSFAWSLKQYITSIKWNIFLIRTVTESYVIKSRKTLSEYMIEIKPPVWSPAPSPKWSKPGLGRWAAVSGTGFARALPSIERIRCAHSPSPPAQTGFRPFWRRSRRPNRWLDFNHVLA